MTDPKLGQIIQGPAHRDAIHIAVAPVVAYHHLAPGQHVGLRKDGKAGFVEIDGLAMVKSIGVVDPFLKAGPEKTMTDVFEQDTSQSQSA